MEERFRKENEEKEVDARKEKGNIHSFIYICL